MPGPDQDQDKDVDTIVQMGGDPENPFTSMVGGVSAALSKIQELLSQEQVPQELVAKVGELQQTYQSLLQQIMQSKGGAPEPQAGAPMQSVNAGPKAVPAQ
jgi:hypothetical protein